MEIRKLGMNKKGSDIPSIIYAIIVIFVIGVIFLVFSNLASNIYTNLQDTLSKNPRVNYTIANETITTVQHYEQSMWDYAFLFIIIGYLIVMMILSFSTQANPYFYVIFIIMAGVGLFVGVALSNAWEAIVTTDALSSTAARFPITDSILNNFFPLFVVMIFVLSMIMLFGKRYFGSGGER